MGKWGILIIGLKLPPVDFGLKVESSVPPSLFLKTGVVSSSMIT
jgi:hypothetical protein